MDVLLTGDEPTLVPALATALSAAGHHLPALTGEPPSGPPAPVCPGPGAAVLVNPRPAAAAFDAVAGVGHLLVVHTPDVLRRRPVAGEAEIAAVGVPWTLQRAALPHSSLDAELDRAADRRRVVPTGLLHQPVAEAVLAARIVALVRAGAAGCVPALAGPDAAWLGDLAVRWSHARGRRLRLVESRPPVHAAAAAACFLDRPGTGPSWTAHLRATSAAALTPA